MATLIVNEEKIEVDEKTVITPVLIPDKNVNQSEQEITGKKKTTEDNND